MNWIKRLWMGALEARDARRARRLEVLRAIANDPERLARWMLAVETNVAKASYPPLMDLGWPDEEPRKGAYDMGTRWKP